MFATVAELNHFADPEIGFTAGYAGPDGPRIDARGLPFTATYLMTIPDRSPGAFRDCLGHLAGYVTHDLTTPFGTLPERVRTAGPPTVESRSVRSVRSASGIRGASSSAPPPAASAAGSYRTG